jgi:hypothetical protein
MRQALGAAKAGRTLLGVVLVLIVQFLWADGALAH